MNKSRKFAALISITFILSMFWCVANAQVQDDEQEGMYVAKPRLFYAGFIGGANFSQVDGDNFAGYHKVGANIGGIGYVQLAKHTAVSWEILFSQRGAKSDFPHPSGIDSLYIVKYGINARYAEIPVMINYFDSRKSHFGVGVAYSRLISATENLITDRPYVIDLDQYPFKKNNFDAVAGADLHLVKGLFLNVRFEYSLTPIRSTSPPNFSRANKQYNNTWTVRLMYLLI